MKQVLNHVLETITTGQELLAVLIDPEEYPSGSAKEFLRKLPDAVTHLFLGGSTVTSEEMELCIKEFKSATHLPLILFPGDHRQISEAADALLFLSLLSGRNPEYLIGQQVKAVKKLRDSSLEIIPTAYLLIDGGRECAVQRVSGTSPLPQEDVQTIVETALAGKYSGKQMIYLEAGSGAKNAIAPGIISAVKEATQLPLVVGGGIKTPGQLEAAHAAGANMVVIGTAFEEGDFF